MANNLTLIMTLRKTVIDQTEAETLADIVKTKLEDHPDVDVKASCSVQIDLES